LILYVFDTITHISTFKLNTSKLTIRPSIYL